MVEQEEALLTLITGLNLGGHFWEEVLIDGTPHPPFILSFFLLLRFQESESFPLRPPFSLVI